MTTRHDYTSSWFRPLQLSRFGDVFFCFFIYVITIIALRRYVVTIRDILPFQFVYKIFLDQNTLVFFFLILVSLIMLELCAPRCWFLVVPHRVIYPGHAYFRSRLRAQPLACRPHRDRPNPHPLLCRLCSPTTTSRASTSRASSSPWPASAVQTSLPRSCLREDDEEEDMGIWTHKIL